MKLVFCPWAVVESVANRALQYARAVAAGEVHRRARGQIYRSATGKNRHSLVFIVNYRRLELLCPSSSFFGHRRTVSKLEPRWRVDGFFYTRGSHTCVCMYVYVYSNVNTRMYTKAREYHVGVRHTCGERTHLKRGGGGEIYVGVYIYIESISVTLVKMIYIFIIWGRENCQTAILDHDFTSCSSYCWFIRVFNNYCPLLWYCACLFFRTFFFFFFKKYRVS